MMSANPELEKLVSAWWAIPGKVLEGWQASLQEGLSPPWVQAYGRSMDMMENLAHTGLRLQADWCKLALGPGRSASGEALGIGPWGERLENMIDGWSTTSQQLASAWFQMMRDLRRFSWTQLPATGSEALMAQAPALHVLQDIMGNSLKVQAAWASLFMPEMAAAAPEARHKEAGREKQERKPAPRSALETEQAA